MACFLTGAVTLLIPLSSQGQSGWAKKKGELFSKVSYSSFKSDRYYNLSGNEIATSTFSQQSVHLYAEYGLYERLTVILDWPGFRMQGFETTETISDIGDLKVGLKYQLPLKIPISLSVLPEFPTANADNFAENKTIPGDRINLPTGDGEFNVHAILAISHSFHPLPAYINMYGGYNFRTEYAGQELSDQWVQGMEVGGMPVPDLWLRAGIKLQQSANDGGAFVSFVRGEGTEYVAWFGGVLYKLTENWGLDAGVLGFWQGLQNLRNIYRAPTFSLGVVFEAKK